MLRFGLLTIACLTIIQSCNAFSLFDDIPLLAGPCPSRTGVTNFQDVSLNGKWYAHWSVGHYSPWSYLPCHTRTIYTYRSMIPRKIITRAKFPVEIMVPFVNRLLEFTGHFYNTGVAGQYSVSYYYRFLIYYGMIEEKTTFLYTHPDGAALVSSCIEYKDFHFESVSFMTKFSDPNDSHISADAAREAQQIIEELEIPGKSISEIDQTDCEGIH